MIPFPFSLLLLAIAALAGVIYVSLGRLATPRARRWGRIAVLALTWTLPLATRGPGPAQLTVGLLVGFLGIRMVALGERWRRSPLPPRPGKVLLAMVTPEELLVPIPVRLSRSTAVALLARGLALAALCVALLVGGDRLRLWRWARALDDLLVLIEVAVGATGVHQLIVGGAGLGGRAVAGLQDHPLRSASFCQFWARRWNRLVQGNLDRGFFRPYGRRRRWVLGTVTAFTASGIMHVIAVLDAERLALTLLPSAAVMTFFWIHGGLVLIERRLGWHHQPSSARALLWARVRTVGLFTLLSPLLLDPFANVVHLHGRSLGGW